MNCGDDAGLSLVEVVVALALIGIIGAAAAAFFISGLASTKKLQSDQVAASVASQALDAARAVSPQPAKSGGVSGVLRGRSQADVQAAFAANGADSTDMIQTSAWDPAGAAGVADDWVPLTYSTTVANTTYQVTTLIGGCYRPATASTSAQNCNVARAAVDDVLIYRVRAVVTWSGKNCTATSCSYRATALIDPSQDVFWNSNLRPYPVDDTMRVSAGDTIATMNAVIGNDDVVYQPGDDPVRLSGANGGAVKGTVNRVGDGIVSYLPTDNNYSGTDAFKYTLIDAQGQVSANAATVNVRILPRAVNDAFTAPIGDETTLNVFANDQGKVNGQGLDKKLFISMSPTLDILSAEPDATLAASRAADKTELNKWGIEADGTSIKFKAPSTTPLGSIVTFYYYLADVEGSESGAAVFASVERAAVRVTVGDCMNISDLVIDLQLDGTENPQELKINQLNDNKSSCQIDIVGISWAPVGTSYQGRLTVGTGAYNSTNNKRSSTIKFTPQTDTPAYFTITYQMYTSTGFTTGITKTIVIRVNPVAKPDNYIVAVGASEFRPDNASARPGFDVSTGNFKKNDIPAGGTQTKVKITRPLSCGEFSAGKSGDYLEDNGVIFKPPSTPGQCTFEYKLVPWSSAAALAALGVESNSVVVTFNVGYPNIHSTVTNDDSETLKTTFISETKYGRMPEGSIPNWKTESVTEITDKNPDTKWFVGLDRFPSGSDFPINVIYKLSSAQTLSKYSITSANDSEGRDPKAWKLYGSTNAAAATNPAHASWTQIDTKIDQTWSARKQARYFDVANPGSYKFYMLSFSSVRNGGREFQIADWTLEF
ncbi:Ig-like domain-containing protein [Rarobacter faecitabidus]|nr:Ig-like domain-containing protein [Rarobacter faecitabidus]